MAPMRPLLLRLCGGLEGGLFGPQKCGCDGLRPRLNPRPPRAPSARPRLRPGARAPYEGARWGEEDVGWFGARGAVLPPRRRAAWRRAVLRPTRASHALPDGACGPAGGSRAWARRPGNWMPSPAGPAPPSTALSPTCCRWSRHRSHCWLHHRPSLHLTRRRHLHHHLHRWDLSSRSLQLLPVSSGPFVRVSNLHLQLLNTPC